MHSNELFQIRLSVDNQTETPELDWNMYDLLMKGWLRWTLNCDQPIFCFRPDQIWDWERLTSPPRMFIFLWNVYWCKDLISVLLSIIYSPLLYHHLQPFWVEMYTPARIVFVSIQFFIFGKDTADSWHIRELNLGCIISTELFMGLFPLKLDPFSPKRISAKNSCTSPLFWPVGIWTF